MIRLGPSELACITHGKVTYRWMFLLALADEKDAACHVQVMVDEPVAQDPSGVSPTMAFEIHTPRR